MNDISTGLLTMFICLLFFGFGYAVRANLIEGNYCATQQNESTYYLEGFEHWEGGELDGFTQKGN